MNKSFFTEEYQQKLAQQFEDETGTPSTREVTDGVHTHVVITIWHYEFVNWLMKKIDNNNYDEEEINALHGSLKNLNTVNGGLAKKVQDVEAERFVFMKKYRNIKKEVRSLNKSTQSKSKHINNTEKLLIHERKKIKILNKRNDVMLKLLKAYRKRAKNVMYEFTHSLIRSIGSAHSIFKR